MTLYGMFAAAVFFAPDWLFLYIIAAIFVVPAVSGIAWSAGVQDGGSVLVAGGALLTGFVGATLAGLAVAGLRIENYADLWIFDGPFLIGAVGGLSLAGFTWWKSSLWRAHLVVLATANILLGMAIHGWPET